MHHCYNVISITTLYRTEHVHADWVIKTKAIQLRQLQTELSGEKPSTVQTYTRSNPQHKQHFERRSGDSHTLQVHLQHLSMVRIYAEEIIY